ncbi:MAG TPA: glutamine amidotransferase, partial [Gemmataceae bacterium]
DGGEGGGEQTLANNSRLAVVDRGGGPYRVLYVCGRPNWEFKYLRRALDEDAEVQLVGLVRIARRQPKFDFRDMRAPETSPLFRNFDNTNPETAERRDQPVLLRLGTRDEAELRTGFPQTAEELYRYHAVILDDVEAAFFTPEQLVLLRNFVSHRGGGFLMLGGTDSFAEGRYDRTPVGDLLPVYLDRPGDTAADQEYHLVLTREGWLQPWVRTRKTEDEERRRLEGMAPFRVLNTAGNVKPGAGVLAQVRDGSGRSYPALVAQSYGKGRSAALLVGDLWRWGLRRASHEEDDFERSWRQTVRWLVGDVPGRVQVTVRPNPESATPAVTFAVRALDPEFLPLDNAEVTVRVEQPDGKPLTLPAEPDGREAGLYTATYVPRQPGAYRAVASVTAPDGGTVGKREAGWVSQPEADEFARMEPDRAYLESLAAETNGEVVDGNDLASFVASLSSRDAPITETWVYPLWHHYVYFLVTVLCLAGEWGLRRVNGLA